jgi:hypothetical protein
MVKSILKTLSVAMISVFVLAGVGQANAKDLCSKRAELHGYIEAGKAAIAKGTVTEMTKVLNMVGAHPSSAAVSGGQVAIKALLQAQLGALGTSLKLSAAACNAHHEYHRHRHLVCAYWHGHRKVSKHSRHAHWACRMRD